MLPRIELAPTYDRVVWLYLYRDFSGSDADRAAERACLRLGFTSYPQHWMIHPETLARIVSTGRSVPTFLAAAEQARGKVEPATYLTAVERQEAGDERAARLRDSGRVAKAEEALEDEDPVVLVRAVEILVEKRPAAIAPRAKKLLAVPNDPLRFAVCRALAKTGDPEAASALAALVREPEPSLNPNVLRIRAVEALGRCGGEDAVAVIAPHAASGNYRNGLTGVSIDALLALAKRHRGAREAVRKALAQGFPEPPPDERSRRACVGLAKRVHAALETVTGRRVRFPEPYDAAAREALRKGWGR